MISAKQTKNILDKTLQSNNGKIDLSVTLVASSNYYTTSNVPTNGSIIINGSITPYDATSITWSLYELGVVTALISGVGNSVAYTLTTSPVISKTYNLIVNYTLGTVSKTKTITTQILVTPPAYAIQTTSPVTAAQTYSNISSQLTSATPRTEEYLSNFFTLVATNTSGNVVFVIPNSFGVIANIMDENDSDIMNEFYPKQDNGTFTVYTMINSIVPSSYKYKIQFTQNLGYNPYGVAPGSPEPTPPSID